MLPEPRGVQYFMRILLPKNKLLYFQGGKMNNFIFIAKTIIFILSEKRISTKTSMTHP